MTVSDKDREPMAKDRAVTHLAEFLAGRRTGDGTSKPSPADLNAAKLYFGVLIAHGWGPRPTVNPTKLGEFIDLANAGGVAVPWRGLQDYLRECGIEVSDG